MYLVGPVPNRSGIRIHPANFMGDRRLGMRFQLNGCISLGKGLGKLAGQRAVLVSRPTVRRFEQLAAGQLLTLEVTDG